MTRATARNDEPSPAPGAADGFDAWTALGMLIQLAVTSPRQLAAARELLEADLAALDLACSMFRPDSELIAVGNAARCASGPVTVSVSPLLAEAVAVSLRAAQLTDGDIDPTVGGVLADLGYDRDFAELTPPGNPPRPDSGTARRADSTNAAGAAVRARVMAALLARRVMQAVATGRPGHRAAYRAGRRSA